MVGRRRPPPAGRLLAVAAAVALMALGYVGAAAAATAGTARVVSRQSALGPVEIGVIVRGRGPLVVLIPSLGRGASDFDDLGARLARAGYRAAAVDPRGVGLSRGPMEGVTLADYADDVAAVVRELSKGPAVVVGHAFGNRVARATAARHPELVSRLVLIAAGGQVAPPARISQALERVFDPGASPKAHLEAVRMAFFARGADPAIWAGGWYEAVARAQGASGRATPRDAWISGGSAPILVIQGAEDAVAPPANAMELARAYPGRVCVTTLRHAGHAMLPEQPAAIAERVTAYLRARSGCGDGAARGLLKPLT